MHVLGALQKPLLRQVCSQTGILQSTPVHSLGQAHVFGAVQLPPLAHVWLRAIDTDNIKREVRSSCQKEEEEKTKMKKEEEGEDEEEEDL